MYGWTPPYSAAGRASSLLRHQEMSGQEVGLHLTCLTFMDGKHQAFQLSRGKAAQQPAQTARISRGTDPPGLQPREWTRPSL